MPAWRQRGKEAAQQRPVISSQPFLSTLVDNPRPSQDILRMNMLQQVLLSQGRAHAVLGTRGLLPSLRHVRAYGFGSHVSDNDPGDRCGCPMGRP